MKQALRPVKRRMRVQHVLWGAQIGLLLTAAAWVALLAVSFFVPIEDVWRDGLWLSALLPLAVLVGLAWPIRQADAARAVDAAGLRERAITALALAGADTPMARVQRQDALERLKAFPVKDAMPLRDRRRLWLPIALCCAAIGVLVAVPNPQHDVLRAREQERRAIHAQAETVERAAEAIEKENLTDEELQELRRITAEMARALRDADNKRDALERLDTVQKDMERLQQRLQQRTASALAQALASQSGLQGLSQAMQQGAAGDMESALAEVGERMESGDDAREALAEQLAEAAEGMEAGETQENLASSAASAAAGNTQQSMAALASAMQNAVSGNASGTCANLSALMRMARSGVAQAGSGASAAGGSQSGQGSGQGAGGQGAGAQGQGAGSGAGIGTTNRDAGYREGMSQSSGSMGGRGISDKVGEYERIYDPTRLGDGGEISHVAGQENEGESQQIQLGAGMGSLEGAVPYNQVIGEYQTAAAQAMRRSALPEALQDWVQRYFDALRD